MLLENLRLTGYRRFEEATNIQLAGKLVAITGPNEAGKTSILRAINHFSNTRKIGLEEKTSFFDGQTRLRLSYFLEKDDLEAAEISEPTWLHYTKMDGGNFEYAFTPRVRRDLTRRSNCYRATQQLKRSKSARTALGELQFEMDAEEFDSLLVILRKDAAFSDDEVETLNDVIRDLPDIKPDANLPGYLHNLKAMFADLVAFESEHDPTKKAFDVLKGRMPNFLFFTDEDRNIDVPYDIRLLHHETPASRQSPSKPLGEIIKMSGLDLEALIQAQAANNNAGTTGLITAANEKLREVSEGIWSQSDACLYFELNGPMLDLLVENKKGFEPSDRYSNLRARSDGYRQFVALHVFTFLNDQQDVVILIDEIEHHLHYDAQADLVQLLQKEQKIKKVIYTTHSAGALPEDLGAGVRLVQWDADNPKRSAVVNRFWKHDDGAGFRPLLFGMGAATFAFFPTRRALIAEGPTELLLLPRLMREATSSNGLEFQVVHGLSNLSLKGLPTLGGDCDNVVFLVDNDRGGRTLKSNLMKSGVNPEKVYSLKDVGSFVTVEDLVDPKVWRDAVNAYIDKYGLAVGVTSHVKKIPVRGRIQAIPERLRKEKISIAYNILDLVVADPSRRILTQNARSGLARLVSRIRNDLL
jgi:energy-coupling factor transporter ATP-binding protein EcfA2